MDERTGPTAEDRRDRPGASWKRIGMIAPSSNTVLEPATAAMLHGLSDRVTAHFARIPVTTITMSDASRRQFAEEPVVEAARLLAETRPDVIAWNGTSASWLGLDRDRRLVEAIERATGVAATTCSLAYERLYRALGVRRVGLVTPYLAEIEERIVENYAEAGIAVVAAERLEDAGNFSYGEYSAALVEGMVRRVAAARPDAVAVVCTNFRGAESAARIEAELGVPVLDSVAVTLWDTLRIAGLDPSIVAGWGRLFRAAA